MNNKSNLVSALTNNNVLTENNMPTNSTSDSFNLDFFFMAGAMRTESEHRIISKFTSAYGEDSNIAMKLLFWARDIRGGAGERRLFRIIIKYLSNNITYYESILKNLKYIFEYGRWNDLIYLFKETHNSKIKKEIINLIKNALAQKNQLCAKWMPRKGYTAKKIRMALELSPKQYRKTLVELSKNVVENKMCSNKWEDIDYECVPSLAMSRYKNSFMKHDKEGFNKYVKSLFEGKKKINTSAIYPHDVIISLENSTENSRNLSIEQWKNLPNWIPENNYKILPVVDVSGSMYFQISKSLRAIDISLSLGLYFSEKNLGKFKDTFMTFSEKPEIQILSGDNIYSKMFQLKSAHWSYNTDIEQVFSVLLNKAKEYNISQDDMPNYIMIISDMEFDEACNNPNSNVFEMIEKEYTESNYKVPTIIFWNVMSRQDNVPIKKDKNGVILISGFSPSILSYILEGNVFNPIKGMLSVVNSERYENIQS